MIGRVLPRGCRVDGLIWYLYGPGKAAEHANPRLVAGWRHPAALEPPLRANGTRDFRTLNGLLKQPVTALGGRAPAKAVWHCVVRAAPEDPDLGDGAWSRIAAEIMHRTGLSPYGQEDEAVRWVAVHHGDNHIHIVATLARQDGHRTSLDNDYFRVVETCRDMERQYGLRILDRADRTAARRPTRAENERAARLHQAEPPRVTLRRQVAAAASAARSEDEFFGLLAKAGVLVRLRHSDHGPREVTGYAAGLRSHVTAAGAVIWYGGGRLAPDLSLPKLRCRWHPEGMRRQQRAASGRCTRAPLHGFGMGAGAARAALRQEVARCAYAARSEEEFFARLGEGGVLVRLRHSERNPAEVTGYAVSLAGHAGGGTQSWLGGGKLAAELSLPRLRRRWQSGQPGIAAAPVFTFAERHAIYVSVAQTASAAARHLRAAGPGGSWQSADIAWAAADTLRSAAAALGSGDLRRAADEYDRAARECWGRIPRRSAPGSGLRTAAFLIAACSHPPGRRTMTEMTLIAALAGLAAAVGDLRASQQRLQQATAARSAAGHLATAASLPPGAGYAPLAPDGAAPVPPVEFPVTVQTAMPQRGVSPPGRVPRRRRHGPAQPRHQRRGK